MPDKRSPAAECLTHPLIAEGPRFLRPSAVDTRVQTAVLLREYYRDEGQGREGGVGGLAG